MLVGSPLRFVDLIIVLQRALLVAGLPGDLQSEELSVFGHWLGEVEAHVVGLLTYVSPTQVPKFEDDVRAAHLFDVALPAVRLSAALCTFHPITEFYAECVPVDVEHQGDELI